MDDLISRKEAIDAVRRLGFKQTSTVKSILCALEVVPAAQPEPKKGAWIEEDDAIIHGHCSKCGWVSVWQETDVFGMNYCPNCGAKMGGNDNADV